MEAELIARIAEEGFTEIEIPWGADVFRGAPQDKNSATFTKCTKFGPQVLSEKRFSKPRGRERRQTRCDSRTW